MAFKVLDRDGSGVVDISDIIDVYDVSKHPEFISGKKTKVEILEELLNNFETGVGAVKDGKVTLEEFENYYANISASIENEDYFELMIRNAWRISGGEGQAANSANTRVLVTNADGTETVQEIKHSLGLRAGDKAKMNSTSQKPNQSLLYKSSAPSKSQSRPISASPRVASRVEKEKSPLEIAIAGPLVTSNNVKEVKVFVPDPILKNGQITFSNLAVPDPSPGQSLVLVNIKKILKNNGIMGYTSIQREFYNCDEDDSKTLTFAEFTNVFKSLQIDIGVPDLRNLFSYFDDNNNGEINFNEFMFRLRDEISDSRIKNINMAFTRIDTLRQGYVLAENLIKCFNSSQHPEVLAGRMTKDQMSKEFMDSFDVGIEIEGKITKNDFINYYSNVSSLVNSDEYFNLILRNCWVNNCNSNMSSIPKSIPQGMKMMYGSNNPSPSVSRRPSSAHLSSRRY
jgi:Ca2+-binding EF-hand superfamily protein